MFNGYTSGPGTNIPENYQKYTLHPGFLFVSREPTIITTILGSCISVTLYDKVRKYGGMNHYIMPVVSKGEEPTCKYGNVAMFTLLRSMLEYGSKIEDLTAQIAGAARTKCNFLSEQIADHNIHIARSMLHKYSIPVQYKNVGGNRGRKIIYDTDKNQMHVTYLKQHYDICKTSGTKEKDYHTEPGMNPFDFGSN